MFLAPIYSLLFTPIKLYKMYKLIKGAHLTNEQKQVLKFNGMSDINWVICHSFYFTADGKNPAPSDSRFYYPVINSFKFLPY